MGLTIYDIPSVHQVIRSVQDMPLTDVIAVFKAKEGEGPYKTARLGEPTIFDAYVYIRLRNENYLVDNNTDPETCVLLTEKQWQEVHSHAVRMAEQQKREENARAAHMAAQQRQAGIQSAFGAGAQLDYWYKAKRAAMDEREQMDQLKALMREQEMRMRAQTEPPPTFMDKLKNRFGSY